MFERYALFYTPTGELARLGAAWLGWNSEAGGHVTQPAMSDIDVEALTTRPRAYGFHATLKAPFYLSPDATLSALRDAAALFAANQPPVEVGEMTLRHTNGFIALRPVDAAESLSDLAAATVKNFDPFRAPMSAEELARKDRPSLTPQQKSQLLDWGYPYIFTDFNFHMTLSGRVAQHNAEAVIAALTNYLGGTVPKPFLIDTITLMGQDSAGMFHQIARHPLNG